MREENHQNMHTVHEIRRFSRQLTAAFGLLDSHYMGSEFTMTEARLLFEIWRREECTHTELRNALHLDKGYLSRLLSRMRQSGLLAAEDSKKDRRSSNLRLTEKGIETTRELAHRADLFIGECVTELTEEQCGQLEDAMHTIRVLLELEG